jgi:hypothetical protein
MELDSLRSDVLSRRVLMTDYKITYYTMDSTNSSYTSVGTSTTADEQNAKLLAELREFVRDGSGTVVQKYTMLERKLLGLV